MAAGRVTSFDAKGGWGEVTDVDSGRVYPFHCTAIADGSRTIEVDTSVDFEVTPGRMGRWEGRGLKPS